MRFKLLLSALLLSVAMVGCNDASIDEGSYGGSQDGESTRSVTYNVNSSYDGRMAVTPENDNANWAFTWEADDSLLGWSNTGYASVFSIATYDSSSSSFTGTMSYNSETMRFIYPSDATLFSETGEAVFSLSSQTIDASDALNSFGENNLYMMSNIFDVAAPEAITMSHIFTYLELSVQASDISDESLILDKIVIEGLASGSATIGYADSAVVASESSTTITIDVTNGSALTNDTEIVIPVVTAPFTITEGQTATITLYFENEEFVIIEKSYTSAGEYADVVGQSYNAGEFNTVNARFSVNDVEEEVLPEGTFYAVKIDAETAVPSMQTWTLLDETITATSTDSDTLYYLKELIKQAQTYGDGGNEGPILVFENLTILPNYLFNTIDLSGKPFDDSFAGYNFSVELPIATTIGQSTFDGSNLTAIYAPEVTTLNYGGLYRTQLTELDLPKVTSVGNVGFGDTTDVPTKLTSVKLGLEGDGVLTVTKNPTLVNSASNSWSSTTLEIKLAEGSTASIDGAAITWASGYVTTFKSINGEGETEEEDETEKPETAYNLADFASLSAAPSSSEWEIWDSSATSADDFADLRSAVVTYGSSYDSELVLTFTNLTSLPDNALSTYTYSDFTGVNFSVNFPALTYIGTGAFYNAPLTAVTAPILANANTTCFRGTSVTSLDLPMVTELGNNFMHSCSSLTSLTLGTEGTGVATTNGATDPFGQSTADNKALYCARIDLSIKIVEGTDSNISIDRNVFTYDGKSTAALTATFKSINGDDGTDGGDDDASDGYSISDFASMTTAADLPASSDWTIIDSSVTSDDLVSLGAAIVLANGNSMTPNIIFSNLLSMPLGLGNSDKTAACAGSFTVELTKATTIEQNAFAYCSGLTALKAESVTSIGATPFRETAITEYSFPVITTLSAQAFRYAYSTKTIYAPKVTVMANNVFANLTTGGTLALTTLTLGTEGDGLTSTSNTTNCPFGDGETNISDMTGVTLNVKINGGSNDYYSIAADGVTLNVNTSSTTFGKINVDGESGESEESEESEESGESGSTEEAISMTLAEISATSYPTSSVWSITDYDATAETYAEFDNLRLAITAANAAGIYPHVVFPNLLTLPMYAFYNHDGESTISAANGSFTSTFSVEFTVATQFNTRSFVYATGVTSITADKLVTLNGEAIFESTTGLTKLKLPQITTIGKNFIKNSTNLVWVEIGNGADCSGVKTITTSGQHMSFAANVDLKIFVDVTNTQGIYVDGNKLYWNDTAFNETQGAASSNPIEFKSINDDSAVEP
ncbi:MAG: leucine-rich repeat protein [Rikenellaceae bacterium]